ncbi:Uu.00g075980.m01.CDS01 [Anthostomella pinea]|uniref:Uu.00g075980.m01.CDS01 n=1 Tax=Anthostomella pinea TaxID=933095 RepID=A0AAI8YP58_9PEZI|nr:Uu.00g075980.m01.CDS01 [Anthostomella pinea]
MARIAAKRMARVAAKQFRFMDLPPELRLMILGHVMPDYDVEWRQESKKPIRGRSRVHGFYSSRSPCARSTAGRFCNSHRCSCSLDSSLIFKIAPSSLWLVSRMFRDHCDAILFPRMRLSVLTTPERQEGLIHFPNRKNRPRHKQPAPHTLFFDTLSSNESRAGSLNYLEVDIGVLYECMPVRDHTWSVVPGPSRVPALDRPWLESVYKIKDLLDLKRLAIKVRLALVNPPTRDVNAPLAEEDLEYLRDIVDRHVWPLNSVGVVPGV